MNKTRKYYCPDTYSELFNIVNELKEKYAFVAGGVTVNWRGNNFPVLISIEKLINNQIEETTSIVKIGAGIKLSALEKFDNKIFRALAQAAALAASPQIRNMATFGGNVLSNFDFSDTLGSIYILKPQFEIITESGLEIIGFEKYFSDQSKRIILPKNTLLNKFVFDKDTVNKYSESCYFKESRVGRDIATIGLTAFHQQLPNFDIAVMGCWNNIECFYDIDSNDSAQKIIDKLPAPKTDLRADSAYRAKLIRYLLEKSFA